MKHIRAAVILLLLLSIIVVPYNKDEKMTKEMLEKAGKIELPTKTVPMKIKMEKLRPEISNRSAITKGETKAALSEGFEGTFPPPGWFMIINADPYNSGWQKTSLQAHSGTYSAYHNDDNADVGCSSWLITPPIEITTGDDTLRYWQYENYATYYVYHGIWIDTTASTDTTNFFELTELGAGTEDTWEELAETLSSFIGDTIRIAFKYQGDYADEWYLDDIIGPEAILPPDTFGPAISEIQYPTSHFYTDDDDSVIAFITDPAGVDSAFIWYYVASWNRIPMTTIGTDSFAAAIPAQMRGTTINWYIESFDGLGNSSTDPPSPFVYSYSILPSSENLIVYEGSTGPANAQEVINAFENLEYDYDVMSYDSAYNYADSVAALWYTLCWVTSFDISANSQYVIENFLTYPEVTDPSDRHALFLSGDDIAWSSTSRDFVEETFRCIYIQDDLSSISDIDTAVGIPGHPITDGMPPYTLSSLFPDLVFTKARSQGDSIDASWDLQTIINGDSINTPGGLVYNGLTWLGAYIPYEMMDFDSASARDTLIRRIMEAIAFAPMPAFVDEAYLDTEHAYCVQGGFSTEIVGYAYKEDGDSNLFVSQVGIGQIGDTLPDRENDWVWFDANLVDALGDEFYFIGQIYIPDTIPVGDYAIAYRFSYEYGPWIYADLDGFSYITGFDYQYDPEMAGTLTVIPKIVINEILYDTPGTDDSLFTELYGPGGASLDSFYIFGVNGSNGDIYEVVDLSGYTIQPDSFFVVASEEIGTEDLIDNVDWQNGPDNIGIAYVSGEDTLIVDVVGYGSYDTTSWVFIGEGMPAPNASEKPIYRYPDGYDTDDNLNDFIIHSRITPGAPNYGPPATHTIAEIQGMGTSSPYEDSLVEISGVITASDDYRVFMQDAYGQWNGIVVWGIHYNNYSMNQGDSVSFVGIPDEYYDLTQLANISRVKNFGQVTTPAPFQTTPGDVDTNEANEGVFVELNLITVANDDIGNGEWIVTDGIDTCIVDDYYSYTTPDSGDIISVLRGPVAYTYGEYKIEPRGDFDILSLDAMVSLGFAPDTVSSVDSITPWAFIGSSLDAPEDSFYTFFEVDTGSYTIHRDSVYDWIGSGIKQVTFNNWAPGFEGALTIRYYTALDFDVNPANNVKEYSIYASGIGDIDEVPKAFDLTVPYISVGMGSIDYAVPEKTKVSLSLFDKLGRRVSVLVDKVQNPGYYQIHLENLDIPSGVYFIKMESSSFESTKKLVLLK